MNSIKSIIALLKSKIKPAQKSKPVFKKVSLVNGFKVISTQNQNVKRFFASSQSFMQNHSREFSQAAHLIASNMKKLKAGEVIESKGFVIKSGYTGKSHSGFNTTQSWSVSHNGKIYFVKMGGHCGERHFEGYKRAEEFFKKHDNQFNEYRVEIVPSHLFYKKSNLSADFSRGFLVSDFFNANKVTLVGDIEMALGERAFKKTSLGKTIIEISDAIFSDSRVIDTHTVNCFVDKLSKTLYFFDLYVNEKYLPK